jgi:hypothetical protein
MGHRPTTQHPISEPRRGAPERFDARPQDPHTNTRPRGNGTLDGREREKSAQKLERVLGH